MKFKPGDLLIYRTSIDIEIVIFLNYVNKEIYSGKCIFSNFGGELAHDMFYYKPRGGNLRKLFNIYTPTKKSTRKKCHISKLPK